MNPLTTNRKKEYKLNKRLDTFIYQACGTIHITQNYDLRTFNHLPKDIIKTLNTKDINFTKEHTPIIYFDIHISEFVDINVILCYNLNNSYKLYDKIVNISVMK